MNLMTEIQVTTLNKALRLLNAVGVQYAVVDHDGNKHGSLEVVAKKKKAPSKYPYGALTAHISPYLDKLEVGDVAAIPAKPYDWEAVYGVASSRAGKLWGTDSHQVGTNKDKTEIQILRTN